MPQLGGQVTTGSSSIEHAEEIFNFPRWSQRDRAGFRPSFLFDSFTKQVLAQLDLLKYRKETTACKYGVYLLPKQHDEQEATLHPPVLGAMLTVFAQEHADYIVVKV